jgi:hypothetical protein
VASSGKRKAVFRHKDAVNVGYNSKKANNRYCSNNIKLNLDEQGKILEATDCGDLGPKRKKIFSYPCLIEERIPKKGRAI